MMVVEWLGARRLIIVLATIGMVLFLLILAFQQNGTSLTDLKSMKWTPWLGRKLLALLLTSLGLILCIIMGRLISDHGPDRFESLFTVIVFAFSLSFLIGLLPSLIVTGISDLYTQRLDHLRRMTALLIHVVGGAILGMLFADLITDLDSSVPPPTLPYMTGFALCALVFFVADEWLRNHLTH